MKTMVMFATMLAMVMAGCASETAPADGEKGPPDEVKAPVEEDTASPAYGSTYSSNCYCALCTKYCDVNGQTVKSGTCC